MWTSTCVPDPCCHLHTWRATVRDRAPETVWFDLSLSPSPHPPPQQPSSSPPPPPPPNIPLFSSPCESPSHYHFSMITSPAPPPVLTPVVWDLPLPNFSLPPPTLLTPIAGASPPCYQHRQAHPSILPPLPPPLSLTMSSPVQLQLFDENSNAASTAGGPSAASLAAAAAAAAAAQAAVAASQPTAAFSQLLNVKDSRWLQVEVCREFQRGQCARSDQECKFAHPPQHVDVQQGRVTACYDSIKGRCTRENPKCKYLHPPQHIKDQLLINGKNNLALKNMLLNGTQQQLQVNPLAAAQLLQQQQSQQLAASMAVPQMAAFPYYHQGLMFQPYQQMQQLDPYQSLLAAAASQPVLAPQLMLAARQAAALAGVPLSSASLGSAPTAAAPAARKRTREDDDDLLGVASKRSAVDKVVFPTQQQFNPYLMNLQYPSVSFSGGQQLPPRF